MEQHKALGRKFKYWELGRDVMRTGISQSNLDPWKLVHLTCIWVKLKGIC